MKANKWRENLCNTGGRNNLQRAIKNTWLLWTKSSPAFTCTHEQHRTLISTQKHGWAIDRGKYTYSVAKARLSETNRLMLHIIEQEHTTFLGVSSTFFSVLFDWKKTHYQFQNSYIKLWSFSECHYIFVPDLVFAGEGCTTTCIIRTPAPAESPKGNLHWPTVLLFSKIFPELISFTSFAAFGVIVFPKEITNKKN